ncbi:GtrA family protein [Dankookia sp. P2]|uniref:GtrA family protein n=1 Tax=Dankookia sp. P2 TaxID=3423955 RepID=UPI003D679BC7
MAPNVPASQLKLLRFGVVGIAGFVVDSGMLTVAIALGLGPWLGRVLSYLAAATTTFALNRAWTFRGTASKSPVQQWALFLAVNWSASPSTTAPMPP